MLSYSAVPTDPSYFPMLLPDASESDAVTAMVDMWNRYKALPQKEKDVLVSDELSLGIKSLQDSFHLELACVAGISSIIRKIFFGELAQDRIEEVVRDALTKMGGDASQSKGIAEYIQKEILTIKPKLKVEEVSDGEMSKHVMTTVKLPLLQAFSKYENLGNQLITRERIRIKSQQEPVRPSLLYWIKYYRDELGIGHHNSVQRGDLLFRSENGKKLSSEERERVNLVLKSVEENVPLEIDTERSEIIFPVFELPPTTPRASFQAPPLAPKKSESREGGNEAFSFGRGTSFVGTASPQTNSGALSFSSKHIFPAEKPETKTSSAPLPKTLSPKPKPNPFHIRPVSLGEDDKR